MSKLQNKIEAQDRTLFDVLNEKKYTVDYFQREYSWEEKHIEELVTDLTLAFLTEYTPGDKRNDGESYNNYFLGPFVILIKDGKRSIIDGQQRLTSLTLFLIFLNNLQKELGYDEKIAPMIFSEHRGVKSFNITVEERIECLESLFNSGEYIPKSNASESVRNMTERYYDIQKAFPEELKTEVFPFFIDWLKYNVVMVEVRAYSDENAYTIFETMNDRGLSLTPSEMLKGYVLSRFNDEDKRIKANSEWKEGILKLKAYGKEEDLRFFQAWLRAQHADSIRPGKAGSKNEDFEIIGTRFHNWVRENHEKIGLDSANGETFENFVERDFRFYLKAYLRILDAQGQLTKGLESVYYIHHWGIAPTLSLPLMLASLKTADSPETVDAKLSMVASYIEAFAVRRSINSRNFSANSIRYTMYSLVKEIRGLSLPELHALLSEKLTEMKESFEDIGAFRLHGQNRRFVKFLLCRITAWCEQQAGMGTDFTTYYLPASGKPFEVEHIWAHKFERHTDEFDNENEFLQFRNQLGGLVLLPKGTNQSYGDLPYAEKQIHYIKENLLVKSLCPLAYENNPNFRALRESQNLPFKPHAEFKKNDIVERQSLYQEICKRIWVLPTLATP